DPLALDQAEEPPVLAAGAEDDLDVEVEHIRRPLALPQRLPGQLVDLREAGAPVGFEYRVEYRLLVGKAVVDGAHGDFRLAGDLGDGGLVEALGDEQGLGGGENLSQGLAAAVLD